MIKETRPIPPHSHPHPHTHTTQCFYNLDPHADIFNHGNVQFWEYAQTGEFWGGKKDGEEKKGSTRNSFLLTPLPTPPSPLTGYDAYGFISCTGTNFLVRATAFREAGFSPEYTLTEDFALGMEMKKRKWECRYVDEYLAVGEAPEQLRNCFQQRSRWCKGHFQIMLSSEHCPLFQDKLPFWQRIMYCTGVWSYIVGAVSGVVWGGGGGEEGGGGFFVSPFFSTRSLTPHPPTPTRPLQITTPMFIIIPLVTIWGGVFPIVVSWWAALGLSVYMAAQFCVMNYVHKLRDLKALWFANVANSILWWTFVKACWRAAGAAFGKGLTFKTTIKGANALMNRAVGDLWMPTTCFLALMSALGKLGEGVEEGEGERAAFFFFFFSPTLTHHPPPPTLPLRLRPLQSRHRPLRRVHPVHLPHLDHLQRHPALPAAPLQLRRPRPDPALGLHRLLLDDDRAVAGRPGAAVAGVPAPV